MAAAAVPTVAGQRAAQAAPGKARRFTGKVVIITGATSGIGAATARAFAAEGARVAFCGRREKLGRHVEATIRKAGGEATYIRADVRDERQIVAFVNRAVTLYGGLDIAFNNAGINWFKPLHEITAAEYDDMQSTNARGVFLAMKHQIPHLLKRGGGAIVVTSSLGVEMARPGGSAYSGSKGTLEGIVKAAALDYGRHNIRVMAIQPGTIDTPMVRGALPDLSDAEWEQAKKVFAQLNIDGLPRMGETTDIATAVMALCSDDFAYMTGASVMVDGGATAGRRMILPNQ
ncbi:SDR family oxidoreductase [Actinomadura rudentiformis]|uniref:SDR family oxidoreductase n=1 Tax=Actinomadura rudentiformis TaxID=359158 RepID=A0A6H9YDT9_9ACTN|nr:SDR family oxidoreductase [Actinomadura rudentiformis]